MTGPGHKRASSSRPGTGRRAGDFWWAHLPDGELLDLRLCELGLRLPGSLLQRRIKLLHEEFSSRGLPFRPYFWLSRDWFSPGGVAGIALPFYLAHPRLRRLEGRQMYEVEGGTKEWCMQLLRHETGHAIDSAYRFHRREEWRRLFGNSARRYPEFYEPKPYSKDYVLHLDWWYAQSHPDEDFAETFAVWLRSRSLWRRQYEGWPALKKLEYVDRLMQEISREPPPVIRRRRVDPLCRIRTTLRRYYEGKHRRYHADYPEIYDRDLRRLFGENSTGGKARSAAAFLRRIQSELRTVVARTTGEHSYTVDQVLRDMIICCRESNLVVDRPESQVKLETAILVSMQIVNYIHGGHYRVPV